MTQEDKDRAVIIWTGKYALPYSTNYRDIEELRDCLIDVFDDDTRLECFQGAQAVVDANWQLLDMPQVKDLDLTSPVVDWDDCDSATRPERIEYKEKLSQRFSASVVDFLLYYDLWLQANVCLITVEGAAK